MGQIESSQAVLSPEVAIRLMGLWLVCLSLISLLSQPVFSASAPSIAESCGLGLRRVAIVSRPLRSTLDTLLYAHKQGIHVEVKEDIPLGETVRGQISNLEILAGRPVFRIGNIRFGSPYRLSVKLLETIKEPRQILTMANPSDRPAAETMLHAQAQHSDVMIGYRSNAEYGGFVTESGPISDVKLVEGKLVFKVGGGFYRFSDKMWITPLKTIRDPSEMFTRVDPSEVSDVKELLKAQANGFHVQVEGGVLDVFRGPVSDVRLVDGELIFAANGRSYGPFHRFSVKVLETIKDPSDIISRVHFSEKYYAETLLNARERHRRVAVMSGRISIQGEVTSVELVEGELEFVTESFGTQTRHRFSDITYLDLAE